MALAAIAVLALLAIAVYAPRVRAAYHARALRRMDLSQLESFTSGNPNDDEGWYQLGLAYARANRYLEATRAFVEANRLAPTRADVLNDLGVADLLQDRYYEAFIALQGAQMADPHLASGYANMGRLHLATKMPFTAVRDLESASRLDPDDPPVLLDLAESYQRTLNYKSAEKAYERVLRRQPRDVAARVGLGRTYFGLAAYDQAEREMRRVLAISPENSTALLTLGRLRLESAAEPDQLDDARKLLERAARADSNNPEIWYDLGRVEMRSGRPEKALQPLQHALVLSPQHAGALVQLSRAYRAVGRTDDANRADMAFRRISLVSREESRLEEQVHQSPRDWNAQARLAALYLGTGKIGLAALICKQIAEGDPGNPRLPSIVSELNRRRSASVATPAARQ